MKNKIRANSAQIKLFQFAYIAYISSAILSELGAWSICSSGLGIIGITLAYLAFIASFKKGRLVYIAITALAFALSLLLLFVMPENRSIIILVALSLSCLGIPQQKIIKLDLLLKTVFVAIVYFCSLVGLSDMHDISRFDSIRHSLGFHHPNYAGLILLNIFMDIVFILKNDKKKIVSLGILFFLVIAIYIDSRSASVGVVLMVLAAIIPINRMLREKRNAVVAAIAILAITTSISIIMVIAPMNADIDKILSGRIRYAKAFYTYYGISAFGNRFDKYAIRSGADQFFVLDNAYLYLLIHTGLVVSVILMTFYLSRMVAATKNENDNLFSILSIYAVVGLMEQAMFQPIKNPFLLLSHAGGEDDESIAHSA